MVYPGKQGLQLQGHALPKQQLRIGGNSIQGLKTLREF